MSDSKYTPPKVWTWDSESGGKWANINRPIAGPTHEKTLPVGDKPLQLYSLGTPNGVKITVMLEELLALGKTDAAYDLHIINIGEGEQFGSDFVKLNPNSKIPVLLDQSKTPAQPVFESCAILHYLAEKFDALMPIDPVERTQCMSWLFWQESSASFLGGGFGHFYSYAPYPMQYPIDRYTMETKRQLDVLDRHLAEHEYMCDSGYSIADIAIWPWYGRVATGEVYGATEFLDTASYKNVLAWAKRIEAREAVQKGLETAL
ncbi:glutathione-dependent disulfide-bond oxidoreductase [Leucothrix sargassi]|nr:glutathione-dependent disulfide-bond oxidoreductase [Leucothrix sargassi]